MQIDNDFNKYGFFSRNNFDIPSEEKIKPL